MPGKLPYTKYKLDAYFQKYPDVNKEVIVKEDLLRLGVSFIDQALEESSHYATKSYCLFSYDQMDIDEMDKKEFIKAPECFKFEGGPYNLRVSNNKTCMEKPEKTPYKVDCIDGQLKLFWGKNTCLTWSCAPSHPIIRTRCRMVLRIPRSLHRYSGATFLFAASCGVASIGARGICCNCLTIHFSACRFGG
jgi:hypothetical protein